MNHKRVKIAASAAHVWAAIVMDIGITVGLDAGHSSVNYFSQIGMNRHTVNVERQINALKSERTAVQSDLCCKFIVMLERSHGDSTSNRVQYQFVHSDQFMSSIDNLAPHLVANAVTALAPKPVALAAIINPTNHRGADCGCSCRSGGTCLPSKPGKVK